MGGCIFIAGANLKALLATKFTGKPALEESPFDFASYQLKHVSDVNGM